MAERCVTVAASVLVSLTAFYLCRQGSAYYDSLKWRAHIRIRSGLLCRLLISPAVKGRRGRLVYVALEDGHKMTCLGLASHLVVDALAVRCIYASIQYGVFQSASLSSASSALGWLVCAALVSGILSTVNQLKVV